MPSLAGLDILLDDAMAQTDVVDERKELVAPQNPSFPSLFEPFGAFRVKNYKQLSAPRLVDDHDDRHAQLGHALQLLHQDQGGRRVQARGGLIQELARLSTSKRHAESTRIVGQAANSRPTFTRFFLTKSNFRGSIGYI